MGGGDQVVSTGTHSQGPDLPMVALRGHIQGSLLSVLYQDDRKCSLINCNTWGFLPIGRLKKCNILEM